jgi:hypothetical protein
MHDLSHLFELLLVVFTVVSAIITIGWSEVSRGAGSGERRRRAFLWFGGSLLVAVLSFVIKYERIPFLHSGIRDSYFADTFKANNRGWSQIEQPEHLIARVEAEQLHIFPRNDRHLELVRDRTFSNFAMSVEFTRAKGHDHGERRDLSFGNGVVFRYRNEKNFYVFLFTGTGDFLLGKLVDGEWVNKSWRSSKHLNSGYERNLVTIVASGPDIALYANDHLIHLERDQIEPYLYGSVGFYVTSGSNLYIDNVSLIPVDISPREPLRELPVIGDGTVRLNEPFLRE